MQDDWAMELEPEFRGSFDLGLVGRMKENSGIFSYVSFSSNFQKQSSDRSDQLTDGVLARNWSMLEALE